MPVAFSAKLAVPPEVTTGASLTLVTVMATARAALDRVPSEAVTVRS